VAVTLDSPRCRTSPAVDQLGDRADGVGERDLRVGEVRVVQVDLVGAELAQALLGVAAD